VLLDGKWKLLGTTTESTYSLTGYTPGSYLVELFPATEKFYGPGNIKSIQVF
jgi:hypothetical protein